MSKRILPSGAFWLATPGYRPRFCDQKEKFTDATEAFYAALTSSTGKLDTIGYSYNSQRDLRPMIPHTGIFYPRGHDAAIRLGSEAQIETFNALFNAVQAAIEAAYQHGLKDGQDLIGQLASGKLTVDGLNRKALGDDNER